MKKTGLTCSLFFAIAFHCMAQTTAFKGQVWSNNSPVQNYTVLIDGKETTTDDGGIFTIPVLNTASQVTLQPTGNRFIVIYPKGGRVLLPKDASLVTQIIVEPFQSNKYIDQYLTSIKQLKDSSGKSQAQLKVIKAQVDSITHLLYQFNYTQQNLNEARERQDGIDLFYPEITTTLQNYINQTRNLAGAFQFASTYAFENHNALDQLVQAVNNYNPAFDKLYTNYPVYSQKIQDYWNNKSLKTMFDGITDTLINVVNKKTVFPLNALKTSINQYFLGQVSAENKPAAKKNIEDQIATIIPKLNDELHQAEQRIQQFQNLLKTNN
jgi:hypothetical protein